MMKIGIVIGAAPIGREISRLRELLNINKTYIIAADGGIELCKVENIRPDEWIGDMDSVHNEEGDSIETVFPGLIANSCSPIKDDTDTALCVNRLFEVGCSEVHIFGGMGGARPEHSIANIQLLHHFNLKHKKIVMYSDKSVYSVLHNEKISFDEKEKGYISIFSLSDNTDVSIKGLFYEYEGVLTNSYALGVSNEFCGKPSSITVKDGVILIIRSDKL